jgi:radical SAM superfamily enzyme YgiQ (UPF0313 family)
VATVALIRPPSVVARYAATLNATPPLGVAYLAGSLTAAGHEVQVIDAVGEAPERLSPAHRPQVKLNGLGLEETAARVRNDADLIGISSQFSHEWPAVRTLIEILARRFPSTPIVCGGEHVSALPELSLRQAPALTACAIGEGEATIVDLASGKMLRDIEGIAYLDGDKIHLARRRARLERVAPPRWDLVPLERYLEGGLSFGVDRGRTIPILATRGCPYRCTFCSSPSMWTTRYQARPPEEVVDEIAEYVARYRVESVDFYDLTAIVRREWVLQFCEQMLRRKLRVEWQLPSGTRSEALDGEVLRAMARAGCRNISYAPESGSQRTLKRILKKVKLERMEASMREAVAAGLNVKANIVIGFPGEARDDLAETLGFIRKMARAGVHDVSVWTFSPYPGTQLFDELKLTLDDDYFTSLLSYSDLGGAVSYCEAFTSTELQRWRVAMLSLFYLESYARHPTRPFRLMRNLWSRRYESRLEMSLANLVRRVQR